MKKRKTKRRHVCVPQRDGTVRCEELSRAESAELWSRIKARTHPTRKKHLNGFRGIAVPSERAAERALKFLQKQAPGGLAANTSKIFFGLKKGCAIENRTRGRCQSRPEMLSRVKGREILDRLTKESGIQGSTDYVARGAWEGVEEDAIVFESAHIGDEGFPEFQSKMNAIAKIAAAQGCQDAVMVVHQHASGRATVDFMSYLHGHGERRYCRPPCDKSTECK